MNRYVNAMRSLALQAINKANQGHSGMSISAAPIIYTLYKGLMTISKSHPKWFNRDRLVLSAGHGSMALYPVFYFSSLLTLDDIKNFRNDNHLTPGHPEVLSNNYIDASTGPLGQGVANAVGMAITESYLRAEFASLKGVVDHYTYCIVGDGDLQEGISYEAMSIAGKLKLSKLIILHDSNDYQLDSAVSDVNIEDLKMRVESMGWNYLKTDNNPENIFKAIAEAKWKKNVKPTFIEVKTIIGEGTSFENSNEAHAAAISKEELEKFGKRFHTKTNNFEFHQEIFDHFFFNVVARGESAYNQWQQLVDQYLQTSPEQMQRLLTYINGNYAYLNKMLDENKIVNLIDSTRSYLKQYFAQLKDLKSALVLSADLAKSTFTKIGENAFNDDYKNPYIKFGIREFAMAGAMNGISLHQGAKAIGGTFLAFSDYMKPAIRLTAISNLANLFIFSHDSYAVGGDGPTHQPVDQLPMLRAIPNVEVIRPADHYEVKHALSYSFKQKQKPICLVTSRQAIKQINEQKPQDFTKGAYIINSPFSFSENPDYTIIASGSEVSLANDAAKEIFEKHQLKVKVISAFNLNLFLQQKPEVIKNLVSSKNGLLAIEASSEMLWCKLSVYPNKFVQIAANQFGRSADGNKLMHEFGFSVENIINQLLNKK
ncbi:transketolase [Ureaplasma urealyticum]|nr:transketolase [Ureaplasma urealyticum]